MNSFFRAIRTLALVAFALTLFAGTSAFAQTFRGTILGSVTDSSGAAVPGATVTIKNLDTGLVRTVTTSDDGSYSAPELPIGNYSVSVEKAGFKLGVVTGIKVEVSSERRADVTLQPGQVAQTVIVQGEELPMVESTSNTLGGIVESKVVTSLPVNGRDYQKLIFLVPGVAGSPDQITDSPGSFGIFSVNGARGRANNFLLDGTDMNDGYRNDPAINEAGVFGTPATILPVEAIAELRVASNFEAEYGRSAGAVVNVVTKSGTNQIHGSVFEFFRNNAMDARNYFNDTSLPQNPFHNNQFGGSLGGPIFKDKTFFFIDYEGLREVGAQSTPSCVPTANDILANAPTPGDPTSINPVAAKILAQKGWPAPNGAGSCIGNAVDGPAVSSNTVLATPFSNNVNGGIIKIDHNFNKDNMLTGRYFLGDSEQSFPLALVGGGALPNYNTFTPTRVQLVSISLVSVISPSALNEVRVGWNRFGEGFFPQDRHFDPLTELGLDTGASGVDLGLPRINVGSFPQLGASSSIARSRVDANWHYIDNISWKHGKHDIKAGYEFRRTTVSQIFDSYFRGRINFDDLAEFLQGTPASALQYSGDSNRNTFENSHSIYIQDSYRWSSRVSLSLGLRYDYYGLIQEKHGNFTNFDPATGSDILVGQGRLYQPDYNNVAPRVSVAWDVTGHQKTVVRAGFGIFYDAFSQDMFEGHLPFNSFYDPGPAYSGNAPHPISVAGASGFTLGSGPVFGFPSLMSDRFGVDQNMRTPYMENYNLNLQQQINRKMTLQVSYVGSQGHKLLRFRDLNQPTLAMIQAYDYQANGCCTPGALPVNAGGGVYYNYEEASGNSIYNSLQTSFRIDNWHGLTSTFNYTWSHSIDDSSDGEDYVPNAAQPDNSQAANRFNRGNSNFDVRNRIAWNFIYEFPNAPDSRYKMIRNGWGVNGIVTVQAGQPFHLNYNFEDDYNGTGEFFARPDVVGPIVYHQNDPTNYLQLTSFAVPCTLDGFGTSAQNCALINPATGAICATLVVPTCINSMHFGSEGRNSLIGPHFRQFDFSIYKKTPITEHMNMELRFEAYNLFNHPNFANPYLPNFIADAAQQGINANGTSAGALHLTATGDVGIGYPFLGSGGPRSLQIAAKFTF
ncbi:MAG TPA: TonB-dependent receptor [Candidatus Acidoferrum sp.]|nr:TonB-dependent receptor [Candidatus Acidoferrum sp.]